MKRPSSQPRSFIASMALCIATYAIGQDPFSITVSVNPPYSASYASYVQTPGQLLVIVTNNSSETRDFYLAGAIRTISGDVEVRVEPGTAWPSPLTAFPILPVILTGTTLEPLLQNSTNEVQYTGITLDEVRTGLLPEGEYQICLRAFDYNTHAPLSSEEPSGCSNTFSVQYPAPPIITSPICEQPIASTTPQLTVFSWMLPSPPAGAVVGYGFRLARWPENIDAVAALETAVDLVHEVENTVAPLLVYAQPMPPLQVGQRYVWRVQATDIAGNIAFQNNGYSEPCSFTYTAGSSLFNLAYPANGDTLPWDFMPILQRFDPYDNYRFFHSTLGLEDNGSAFDPTDRLIHWNSGPQPSQEYVVREGLNDQSIQITQLQSQHVNIYRSPTETTHRFVHGHRIDLSAMLEVALDYDGANATQGSLIGGFVSGMGKPVPTSPAENAVIPKNGGDTLEHQFANVPLRFKTSAPPTRATPPFPIWYVPTGGGTPTHIDGHVAERWLLEVAKEPTFATPIATQNERLGANLSLLSASCDEQCVISTLYKDVSYDFTPPDTGTYYWRVRWLNDPDATTGTSYLDGPTRKFRITSNSNNTSEQDTTRTTPGECLAGCRAPAIALAQKIPVSTAAVNDTIQVGLFAMRITEILWTGADARGKGTIAIPFMNAPLRVSFDRIRINDAKRLFEGEVKGMYDNADVIPAAWIQGSALAVGFNAQDAEAIENFVNAQGRLVSQMTMSNPMGLPIAIDAPTPDGTTFIGILALQFTDTLATMNAAMSFPLPNHGFNIGLGAMDIPFHPNGPGCGNDQAVLYMVDDVKVDLSAEHDTLVIKAARFAQNDFTTVQDSGTFVAWDCRGFRALTISGEVRFSPEHLVEDLENGNDGPTKVVGAFKARTGRHGFLASIDFNKPFHVKGGKGWGFDVQEAWYDAASYTNPPGIRFPENYARIGEDHEVLDTLTNTVRPLWEGIWVKRAMMRLPEEIEAFEHDGRVTVLVDDLIYDDDGLSASIKAANVIGPDGGNLDGWGFSIDTLQLDVVASSFSQGGFKGRVHIPVTDTLLVYSAMLQQNIQTNDWRAQFLMHPRNAITTPLWHATMELEETSNIQAIIGDDSLGTYAKLELNGKITIDKSMPSVGRINFKDIHFNHLTFQTKSPYTNADDDATFSFTSPQKFIGGSVEDDQPTLAPEEETEGRKAGGFPVSITRVELTRRNPDGTPLAGLAFDINLNLTGEVNVFAATTRIAVLGELNTEAMHRWGHNSLALDSIGVSGDVGVVKVRGGLRFYNGDNTYGDGIKGLIRAEFMKGKLMVQAAGQFGNVNGTRYWFVDAQAAFEPGITPYPGFTIYGFGGGAWHHMRRASPLPNAQALVTRDTSNASTNPPGYSLSDVVYAPDPTVSYGFNASMIFGNPGGGQAYNADVTLGAELSSSGGVSRIFLEGHVYFMTKKDERVSVPVSGIAAIQFDFPNEVFTANFDVYVNIKNGLVRGIGPNDLAGRTNLMISADDWHFFAGTPQVPIGLKFAGLFTTTSYFMIGKNLPEVLPPPSEVTSQLGITATSLSNGRPDLSSGLDGFAFGSRMSLSDTLKFLLLRFRLAAGMGFDMSLLDHGSQSCAQLGLGEQIGVNGWYASGQVFGYFAGAVSLYVDVWAFDGEIDILDIGAAVLLQGGLPNPSWMTGTVGGHYNVLHGLVSGDCSFPMEIGAPCSPPNDGLLTGLDPIGDLSPPHNAQNVDCGINPEAVLNMKVNRAFDVYEVLPNGDRKLRTFRLSIEKFELHEGSNLVTTRMDVATAGDNVMLVPNAFLKALTNHTVSIKLKAEEKNLSTDVWVPALKNGQPITWERTHPFRTGPEPSYIHPDYVNFSYPFHNQRFFLQSECSRGVLELRQDMTVDATGYAIFNPNPAPNKVRSFKVLFTPTMGGATQEVIAEINGGTPMRIYFSIPPLLNQQLYTCQFISRDSILPSSSGPLGGVANLGAVNATDWQLAQTTTTSTSQFNNMVNVNRSSIQGYTLRSNEKLLYTFYFGTSNFDLLNDKVASLQTTTTYRSASASTPGQETLSPGFVGERFDQVDIVGYHYGQPGYPGGDLPALVTVSEARTDNWTTSWNQPLLYDYYNAILATGSYYTGFRLNRYDWTWANTPGIGYSWVPVPYPIGIPPVNTVAFYPNGPAAQLLNAQETAPSNTLGVVGGGGLAVSTGGPVADVVLNVETGIWVNNDFMRFQTITADIMSRFGSPFATESFIAEPLRTHMKNYLNTTSYRTMYSGDYQARFQFHKPFTCPGVIYMMNPLAATPVSTQLPGAALYHHTTGSMDPLIALFQFGNVFTTFGYIAP